MKGVKKSRRLSFRMWVTIITLVLLVGVVIAAWPEVVKAWLLLDKVNIWILSLLIPIQLYSYYTTGGIIFSYLKSKGNLKGMSRWSMSRLALELNFVNHALPSGGAAGFSYLSWVLHRHKVSASRSTMAQIVRFTLTFVSFVMLLVFAMISLAFARHIDQGVVVTGTSITLAVIAVMTLLIWLLSSRKRLDKFSLWLEAKINAIVSFFTRGRQTKTMKTHLLVQFFDGLHDDYLAIRKERRILLKPYIWATVANIADGALIWVAFWSLGFAVDPALLFIAYGIASVMSAISVTPGGAGVYEAVMVTFLTTSGVPADAAIAGTLLARVILVLGTIIFGYAFYQMTILKYGKAPLPPEADDAKASDAAE